jgi:hypothetical protein
LTDLKQLRWALTQINQAIAILDKAFASGNAAEYLLGYATTPLLELARTDIGSIFAPSKTAGTLPSLPPSTPTSLPPVIAGLFSGASDPLSAPDLAPTPSVTDYSGISTSAVPVYIPTPETPLSVPAPMNTPPEPTINVPKLPNFEPTL